MAWSLAPALHNRSHSGAWSVLLVAWIALAPSPATLAIECLTPREWQPKLRTSILDVNANQIEDTLEGAAGAQNVVVALNGCPSPADRARLASFGTVTVVGRHLSFAVIRNVTNLTALAGDASVAFVEKVRRVYPGLDVSNPTIKVRASVEYSPDTLEDEHPLLNGAGINVAVIDTGVDDGVHSGLAAAVYSADCQSGSCTEGVNPDDGAGHGTHVAGILLGTGGPSGQRAGIAPAAGLIDIQVLHYDAEDDAWHGDSDDLLAAMELVINRKTDWEIGVVNMSLLVCEASDGTDVFSAMITRMVSEGIVVAVCAGNSSNCGLPASSPLVNMIAASDDVIAVANTDDFESIDRTDDTINTGSLLGPRMSDQDLDTVDEQKPDLAAPGTDIDSARHDTTNGYVEFTGTSMASPHVAGCAALLLDADPTMLPRSLRERLLSTTQDKGTAGWDVAYGHGLLDCFLAVDDLPTTGANAQNAADVGFVVYKGYPLDDPPDWNSPEIYAADADLEESVPTTITAVVTNFGPGDAMGIQVNLGVYGFSNSDSDYHICTEPIPFLADGATAMVSCPYTPTVSGSGVVHACLHAEVIYPEDKNFLNNRAQHNLEIEQTASPATFLMSVVNPTREPLTMDLRAERCRCGGGPAGACPCPGWGFSALPDDFPLLAVDCPRTVQIIQTPLNPAVATRTSEVDVAVVGARPGGGELRLGGVSTRAVLGCQATALRFTSKTHLAWNASIYAACPAVFDVARGPLPILRAPGPVPRGDFTPGACLADNHALSDFGDVAVPSPGLGFWYLVRAGGASPGTYDEANSTRQAGSRDDSLESCP